jgi:hypothetical protein
MCSGLPAAGSKPASRSSRRAAAGSNGSGSRILGAPGLGVRHRRLRPAAEDPRDLGAIEQHADRLAHAQVVERRPLAVPDAAEHPEAVVVVDEALVVALQVRILRLQRFAVAA